MACYEVFAFTRLQSIRRICYQHTVTDCKNVRLMHKSYLAYFLNRRRVSSKWIQASIRPQPRCFYNGITNHVPLPRDIGSLRIELDRPYYSNLRAISGIVHAHHSCGGKRKSCLGPVFRPFSNSHQYRFQIR